MAAMCSWNDTQAERESWCGMLAAGWLLFAITCGCSGGPPALTPPDLQPESAADGAIALYDKDGSGDLSTEELEACPGVLGALGAYDQNDDKKVTRDEFVARLNRFASSRVALTQLIAIVYLDQRPLEGATVRLVPEPYFEGAIKPATCTTGQSGSGMLDVDDSELPSNQAGMVGVQLGTYRVEITHPEISIPAKFNVDTKLGYDSQPGNLSVKFHITSK
ncbi:MAG: EF-hand domain-containing protein [Planctomycetales bacterium]|nr:EF-hand domain-containing protein [Planctomycetales bacterium]